jgi:hypothetical protein
MTKKRVNQQHQIHTHHTFFKDILAASNPPNSNHHAVITGIRQKLRGSE